MPEEGNTDSKQEGSGFDTKLESVKYSLLGEILSDRYIVVDAIGEGALSIVYLGQSLETQDKVAIKTLKFKNQELESRFLEQSNIFKELKHPNIVEILDVFTHTNGQPVVVMRYVEGITLSKLMESAGRIEEENTLLSIVTGACEALEYAHMKSLYHGGLTPNQLLVSETSESDDLKVTVSDFGTSYLSSLFKCDNKNTNSKEEYLSPEQKNGEYVAFNTDVFSLGLVLYELVSGKQPFATKKLSALVEGKSSTGPTFTPITHMALKLSGLASLNQILESSLDNDPDWRMPSISQFKKEMQEWHTAAINELDNPYTDLSQFDDIDFEDLEINEEDEDAKESKAASENVQEAEAELQVAEPQPVDQSPETAEVEGEKDEVTSALLNKINKAKEAKAKKVRKRPRSERKQIRSTVRTRRRTTENKTVSPKSGSKTRVAVMIFGCLMVAALGGYVALNFDTVKGTIENLNSTGTTPSGSRSKPDQKTSEPGESAPKDATATESSEETETKEPDEATSGDKVESNGDKNIEESSETTESKKETDELETKKSEVQESTSEAGETKADTIKNKKKEN